MGDARRPDDLREQLADVLHEDSCAQSCPVRGRLPRLRVCKECHLRCPRGGARYPPHALVVVGLASAIVAVTEGVAAALEDVEPERPGLCGALGKGVGLGENADGARAVGVGLFCEAGRFLVLDIVYGSVRNFVKDTRRVRSPLTGRVTRMRLLSPEM